MFHLQPKSNNVTVNNRQQQMKPLSTILPFLAALMLGACGATDETPMLKGHVAENDQNIAILLHQTGGSKRFDITPDAEGNFRFSPDLNGRCAEITISHNAADFGAFIQEGKTSRMTIAGGSIIFTGDNKEVNEFCNSFHHLFAKDNFRMHDDDAPDRTSDIIERLEKANLELRQVLATVSDNELRERLTERTDSVYCRYCSAVRLLNLTHDMTAYNNAVESIDMLYGMVGDDNETTQGNLTAKLKN